MVAVAAAASTEQSAVAAKKEVMSVQHLLLQQQQPQSSSSASSMEQQQQQQKVIPDDYVVPEDGIPIIDVGEESRSIPLIDLQRDLQQEGAMSKEEMARKMAEASSEWGFFQVVNHGIDLELLRKAQQVSREFFALPLEEKSKYAAAKYGFSEDGYGSRVMTPPANNAANNNSGAANGGGAPAVKQMWRDYILLCTRPTRNTQRWPAHPADYRETMERLSDEFLKLSQWVLELLSLGLGLRPSYISDALGQPTQSIMTNYYPACPEPDKVIGFRPHSDFGGLTLLLQDGTPGLQVLHDNAWVVVKPIPSAITINISDLLELMSNGRYKSVTHRVRVNSNRPRMSIASNYSCSFQGSVAPAPELIDEQHPQRYKPVVFGDYVAIVAARGPVGKSYMMLTSSSA